MNPVLAAAPDAGKKKKLLDQMRDQMRLQHYSCRTEEAYCDWVRRYIRFHGMRHPREMGTAEVAGFLSDLAGRGRALPPPKIST